MTRFPAAVQQPLAGDPQRIPVVVAGLRTPICRAGGQLRNVKVHELMAAVWEGLLNTTDIPGTSITEVLMGNAVGGSGNPARLSLLEAGIPPSVPALTVDRQCTSGLDAIVMAARYIQAGAGEIYLAGGGESISTAPLRATRGADNSLTPYSRAQFAPIAADGSGDPDMGIAAENVAVFSKISRQSQDEFALRSHQHALESITRGTFAGETTQGQWCLAHDDGPRASLTAGILSRFPPAFVSGGTVTAGNSCFDADAAAGVLVMSLAQAQQFGISSGMVFVEAASAGVSPELLGLGAAAAAKKLRVSGGMEDESHWPAGSLIEFNEAFAAQTLACLYELGLDPSQANRSGGALALGHAYGASGAILVVRLMSQLHHNRINGQEALALMSGAGGLGVAAHFQYALDLAAI
ncbi:thiolase family protein [Pseudarthrobacter sp. J1763]|uniref:thiolase family protein n=1 Tax=Pseudarthrobacter sp. J1763 TaxID=3420445 RepID=UPI003D2A0180